MSLSDYSIFSHPWVPVSYLFFLVALYHGGLVPYGACHFFKLIFSKSYFSVGIPHIPPCARVPLEKLLKLCFSKTLVFSRTPK